MWVKGGVCKEWKKFGCVGTGRKGERHVRGEGRCVEGEG